MVYKSVHYLCEECGADFDTFKQASDHEKVCRTETEEELTTEKS